MDAIEQLIADFQERPLPVVSPRLTPLPDASNMARVVIGMRRSGKTYLLFQEMQRLVAADLDWGASSMSTSKTTAYSRSGPTFSIGRSRPSTA